MQILLGLFPHFVVKRLDLLRLLVVEGRESIASVRLTRRANPAWRGSPVCPDAHCVENLQLRTPRVAKVLFARNSGVYGRIVIQSFLQIFQRHVAGFLGLDERSERRAADLDRPTTALIKPPP